MSQRRNYDNGQYNHDYYEENAQAYQGKRAQSSGRRHTSGAAQASYNRSRAQAARAPQSNQAYAHRAQAYGGQAQAHNAQAQGYGAGTQRGYNHGTGRAQGYGANNGYGAGAGYAAHNGYGAGGVQGYGAGSAQGYSTGSVQGYSANEYSEYNDYARYVEQRKQRHKKSPLAIGITIALLLIIGVGAFLIINPLSFDITVNGVRHTVSSDSTLQTVLDKNMASPQPGNLLAVDGSVCEVGGGDKFSATINGQATTDASSKLHKNDAIEITNGADTTETYQTTTEEIPYERSEDDNYWSGSLHVYIAGQNGIRTTKTGDVSGISVTEDTQAAVNEEYKIYTASTGDDKVIALTFDDGPWPTTTSEILDVLKEYNAKATFFTIGNQISENADLVKRAANEGHQICTHTWDHAAGTGQGVNLTYMSADEQINEVEKGFSAIEEVTGTTVSRVMRAPGGNFHGSIIWTLQPYITAEIGWDIDTEDWRRPGASTIAQRILEAKSGNVVLMHDGGGDRSQTVEALKQALPTLVEQGYKFVTVDELLKYNIPSSS